MTTKKEGRIVGNLDGDKLMATINRMIKQGWRFVGYMVYEYGDEAELSNHAFLEREVQGGRP